MDARSLIRMRKSLMRRRFTHGIHTATDRGMNKTLTTLILTLLVAAPAALALDVTSAFSQFDRNRDGRISRTEFPGDAYQFNLADRNRDGVITRTEAQRVASDPNLLESEYRRLDTNRDGMISRSEWRGDLATFTRLDRNRDGVLSQADRSGYGSRTNANRGLSKRFQGMDRNGDGRITRGEWRGNDTSFRNHDRNRDGVLSGSELRSGKKK